MFQGILHIHNMLRWLLLASLVFSISMAIIGWLGNRKWTKTDNISGIILIILSDIQLVIGLLLYFFFSTITKTALSDFGTAMKNDGLRFFAVEHFTMMLIAVILLHIGRTKSKNAQADKRKHILSLIFYGIACILIVIAIPWQRTGL